MSCESLDPTFSEKFAIFKRKHEIEASLARSHEKNTQKSGYLDVTKVYTYEKLLSKFSLHEYITVHAALNFWRELL